MLRMLLHVLQIKLKPEKAEPLINVIIIKRNEIVTTVSVHDILTNEIIAANSKILTKRSSNCSRTNCHILLPTTKFFVNIHNYYPK